MPHITLSRTRSEFSTRSTRSWKGQTKSFFITFAAAHSLDGQYTIFAHVTEGLDVLPKIVRGEPPVTPTRMQRVYIVEK